MEFGALGLDGFQSSENALPLDGEMSKHKWAASAARSVSSKQDGSGFCSDDWRSAKVARTDAANTALFLQSGRNLPFNPVSDANMLSFSSCSKSDSSALPYFQPNAPKSTGYYSGNLNGTYLLNGVRGPFTPSQWYELEQQALIYKYMTANEPIPTHLLIPIKKALESAGLFGFTAGTLRPTPWGWGPFHFGYSNSNDPEPGRCRRTDGKKWRCSRDAMPDQKYCERHMNRGRHRSRKHVEGQATTGHSTKSTTAVKPPSVVAQPAAFDMTRLYNQPKSLQHSMNPLLNRNCEGVQDTSQLSFLSLSGSNPYSVPKHQNTNSETNLFTITTNQKNPTYDGSSILWPGLDTTQHLEMGLGVGSQSHNSNNNNNSQSNWTSSSWEPSIGGPLGEALQSGNGDCKGMGGYQLSSSSPTGVLQRSALVSLSNSSAGSSPRNDVLGSTTLPIPHLD